MEEDRWEGKALDRNSTIIGEIFEKKGYTTSFCRKVAYR